MNYMFHYEEVFYYFKSIKHFTYMSKAMTFKQCSQNIQIFFEASIIINIYCKFKRFPLNKAIDRNIKPGDEDDFWCNLISDPGAQKQS